MNRLYHGELTGTTLKILAADLERQCEEAGTDIVVSPYASEGKIVLETVRDGDEVVAAELLRRVMDEHDLAGVAS